MKLRVWPSISYVTLHAKKSMIIICGQDCHPRGATNGVNGREVAGRTLALMRTDCVATSVALYTGIASSDTALTFWRKMQSADDSSKPCYRFQNPSLSLSRESPYRIQLQSGRMDDEGGRDEEC